MSNWIEWMIIIIFAMNSILVIRDIGKQRTPVTPGYAAFMVTVNTVIIGYYFWRIVTGA